MATTVRAYAGVNHRTVRQGNRATVFRAIRALAPIARVDLVRETGLGAGTVTNIVDELMRAGLVSETGHGTSATGRRPTFLDINPQARFAVGVNIARDAITAALIDLTGGIHARFEEPAGPWLSGESVIAAVGRAAAHILDGCTPTQRAAVTGIGIGVVGPFSVRSRRFLSPPSFGSWQDLALGERIQGAFGVPTYVDNNGNTSALAELWFGAGQGVEHFVLLSVGTGVGAGLVLDGDLYRGDHDLAGELGHMSVNADGPRCACGNYGCLEMYVAVPRILGAVQVALATGEPSALRPLARPADCLTLAAVLDAARAGDALATRVLADVTRLLAVGIVNIVHAFDPRLVLIARELGAAGDFVLEPVRAEVRRRVFPVLADAVRIEAAALPDAPVIGAATLALREFFRAPLAYTQPAE